MRILRFAGVAGLVLTLAGTAFASTISQDTRNDNGKGPSSASAFLSSFNALTSGGVGYDVTTDIATWSGLDNSPAATTALPRI